MPSYLPVMQYADSRRLRAVMYRANATCAAEFGPVEFDNTPLIRRILELRQEEARLLGYNSFAEVSLVRKMAESVPQVLSFLRDLAVKARPFAQKTLPNCVNSPVANWRLKRSRPGMSVTLPKNYCRRATLSPNRK